MIDGMTHMEWTAYLRNISVCIAEARSRASEKGLWGIDPTPALTPLESKEKGVYGACRKQGNNINTKGHANDETHHKTPHT